MTKIKNGLQRHARHRKFIKMAKGYRLGRNNVYKQVRLALVKAGQHSYEDRKLKKRNYRRLWIERLSAVLNSNDMRYSRFIKQMSDKNIVVNRKVLSNIAVAFPVVFDGILAQVVKS